MTKFAIPSASIFLAISLLSCSKEAINPHTPGVSSQIIVNSGSSVKIASAWFSPLFNVVSDRNSIYLIGHRDHETNSKYDRAMHVELAYIKLNYQRAIITRRMPVTLSCSHIISNELCEINFGLNDAGCDITIRNADRNSLPIITINPFPDMQVRYIVISKALFNSLNINWDDYTAVVSALNI